MSTAHELLVLAWVLMRRAEELAQQLELELPQEDEWLPRDEERRLVLPMHPRANEARQELPGRRLGATY
jgi:hypothetical protein